MGNDRTDQQWCWGQKYWFSFEVIQKRHKDYQGLGQRCGQSQLKSFDSKEAVGKASEGTIRLERSNANNRAPCYIAVVGLALLGNNVNIIYSWTKNYLQNV